MAKRLTAGCLLLLLLISLFPWHAQAQSRATLRWGSTGSDVRFAQQRLKAWGYYRGAVDGVYGPLMYAAVIRIQRKYGLTQDGVVGPSTWALLGETVARAPSGGGASGVTRVDDLTLLAMVTSAEARGEPYEGQVAVAAVILNRVRDPRFPNTLAGVVYQAHAFESVSNGQIYVPVAASARRAARDAMNGWDPTGGSVFFWNPSKAVSKWIWSRPVIRRIGNHVFAK